MNHIRWSRLLTLTLGVPLGVLTLGFLYTLVTYDGQCSRFTAVYDCGRAEHFQHYAGVVYGFFGIWIGIPLLLLTFLVTAGVMFFQGRSTT